MAAAGLPDHLAPLPEWHVTVYMTHCSVWQMALTPITMCRRTAQLPCLRPTSGMTCAIAKRSRMNL